jgi:excisionase family DNA binding protein
MQKLRTPGASAQAEPRPHNPPRHVAGKIPLPLSALLPRAVEALAAPARANAPLPQEALEALEVTRQARDNTLLTHREAAAYLRVSPRTLDTLVANGEITPARPSPRKRLYAIGTLNAYLRASARRRGAGWKRAYL